jgi:hypothetical protein
LGKIEGVSELVPVKFCASTCGKARVVRSSKPIARRTRLSRGGPIRRVSKKRRAQLVEYGAVRLVVIARDGGCVLTKLDSGLCALMVATGGVGAAALECEHAYGRRGKRLLDPDGCVALHRACHRHVTDHAKEWKPRLREYLSRLPRVAA